MLPTQNLSLMNKYANGYLPKIAYHMVVTKDQAKVDYFAERQLQTYGENTLKMKTSSEVKSFDLQPSSHQLHEYTMYKHE